MTTKNDYFIYSKTTYSVPVAVALDLWLGVGENILWLCTPGSECNSFTLDMSSGLLGETPVPVESVMVWVCGLVVACFCNVHPTVSLLPVFFLFSLPCECSEFHLSLIGLLCI